MASIIAGRRSSQMFGSRRKKAASAAIDGTRPIIGIVQHNYGLPALFWSDPYVLGFIHFTISHFAKLATGGKVVGADLGFAIADTFTALSNQNGAEISRFITELAVSDDVDFNKGADDAARIQFYRMGILKDEAGSELVQKARAFAARMEGSLPMGGDERSRVAAAMVELTFMAELRERFDLSSRWD